ncbi:MAG: hypothetical protein JO320_28310 [Alphaproteobacteria bacterium]|nr:hypothetical protein [Alphaproteobacteria bacterium]MBV9378908.1 hypothetical protein [Alphaproteobacteria bacterium]
MLTEIGRYMADPALKKPEGVNWCPHCAKTIKTPLRSAEKRIDGQRLITKSLWPPLQLEGLLADSIPALPQLTNAAGALRAHIRDQIQDFMTIAPT